MNVNVDKEPGIDTVLHARKSNTKEGIVVERKLSLREMLDHTGKGLDKAGYQWQRMPKTGRKRVWALEKDGKTTKAAVRTSQDRWFAFPRKGDGWKTLDQVGADAVVVAAVDDPDRPKNIEVYVFPADEVRRRFNENYQARGEAGHAIVTTHQGHFGMWIALDRQPAGSAASVGSGLAQDYPAVAVVPIAGAGDAGSAEHPVVPDRPRGAIMPRTTTIAEVIGEARRRIAEISGMPFDKVSLELRIG
ncbi:MAG: hypothetical protein V3R74_08985 [Alphaproteobacteria bacterium]